MNGQTYLSPFGTVRSALLQDKVEAGQQDLEAFLVHLMSRLRLFNLEEEVVQIPYEMVGWQSGLDLKERKSLILLVLCALINLQQGSTRLPIGGAEERWYLLSMLDTLIKTDKGDMAACAPGTAEEILVMIEKLLSTGRASVFAGGPGDYKPLIFIPPYLYHQKMLHLEDRFIERLGRFFGSDVKTSDDATLSTYMNKLDGKPFDLSEDQKRAVLAAAGSPFAIISGGPGTGKTSVIVSILRVLIALGVEPGSIALAAPTGKAANRMGEAVRKALISDYEIDLKVRSIPAPRTLHRLLGYSPGQDRFSYHENNRLSERVVIVDEGSMIDLSLMEHMVRSVRDGARLVLIGDADQLPSVEAGAVFRDLAEHDTNAPFPVIRLTKNYRMDEGDPAGKSILSAAGYIKDGDTDSLFDLKEDGHIVRRTAISDLTCDKAELLDIGNDPVVLEGFLEHWHKAFYKFRKDHDRLLRKEYKYYKGKFGTKDTEDLTTLFQHMNRAKILCLTRVYSTGTDSINRFFHDKLLEETTYEYPPEYIPGEPVMMHHNDYERNIFNGDQGIVLRVGTSTGQHFMAVFRQPEGYGAFHVDALRSSIKHAFAITVHKSQGSEYDHVAVILPAQTLPILTQEMLYTAITRSRKSATIVGPQNLLEWGAQRRMKRFSGIGERIINSSKG